MIIQNSRSSDTVIAFTNEQIIKFNQEHVVLKQCIEYSNLQDSNLLFKNKVIDSLTSINQSIISLDSLSRESLRTQAFMLKVEKKEKEELQQTFTKYQKQVKRDKRNTWFYNSFITAPIVITLSAVATFLITK